MIRTMLVPKPGCEFIIADFSAIEARVLAWLAGEQWRIDAFERGDDIYCASASQMFGVPVVKHGINGELRQKGKVAELACGYGGGAGALISMGALDNLLSTKDSVYHAPFTAVRLPFRVAEMNESCFESIHPRFAPYVHQQKAFDRLNGNDGQSTVIATGTGSGKTECFLYPILEYCYKHLGEPGIKALIIKEERNSLRSNIKALDAMIDELKKKPKDPSFDEQIKELNAEKAALHSVINEINNKNVFNFLSDEGLLPNYAFPENGIILRALLYRKDEQEGEHKGRYEKRSYEYSRPASSAISEFAPDNTFYADGRKLTVNQIDLHTTTIEPWRLCPNCSHAQLEVPGKYAASCPQCGSPAWADSGQLRNMLKVQMVYSNTEDTHSRISDESDSRSTVFYVRQLLVDVDEDHDILSAYRMNNDDFPFGYEFVKKAALRG